MLGKYLLICSLLIATISAYGNTLFERSMTPRAESPKSIVTEDGEEVCGDVAEADHIVISKQSMSLKLYDRNNRLICRFPVSLGRHYGDKQELGDCKTPEGDYSIIQIQRASHWIYNDGKESIKGYYGNWFIRLNTKYSGIGIHGTHEPERIGERTTEGSIRLENYHLDSLRAMVDLGMMVRIESSQLDREANSRNTKVEDIQTIIAENAQPIMNESATPVIEEHAEVAKPVEPQNEEVAAEEVAPKPTEIKANEDNEEWYTIQDGDLVGRVAARYGMTITDIKRLNPDINVDRVSIGQKIRVRGVTTTTESDEQPIAAESISNNDEVWHTVVDGDLVGRIASQYGTTVKRLQELNPNLNPDRISIGQRIRVSLPLH